MYIDVYHCDIKEKNKIRKTSVYVVLRVDLQGNKDIFGFYTWNFERFKSVKDAASFIGISSGIHESETNAKKSGSIKR
jgi:hypothetical protein